MDKIKITQEQADSIEKLRKGNFCFRDFMNMHIQQTFGVKYLCLLDLEAEDLAKALLYGYEIEIPKPPQYISHKIDVSVNMCNEDMRLNHGKDSIYIGIFHNMDKKASRAFSIEEAGKIRDTLTELIDYYNQYVKRSDKQ